MHLLLNRRSMAAVMRVLAHTWSLLYMWLVLAYLFGVLGMFLFAFDASSPEGRAVCLAHILFLFVLPHA